MRVITITMISCLLLASTGTMSAAQQSEAECKKKYLIDTKPEDWKKFTECLTRILQCKDCGTQKEKQVPK
jgi:glutamine cyclotransferase